MCSCGEGVLADTALIGLPEIVPNYRFAAVHSCTRPSWICPKAWELGVHAHGERDVVDGLSSLVLFVLSIGPSGFNNTRTAPHHKPQVQLGSHLGPRQHAAALRLCACHPLQPCRWASKCCS